VVEMLLAERTQRTDGPFPAHEADRELVRRVISFLNSRSMPGLRRLNVEARHGTVTLSGRVRSFYEKQVATHSCRRVAGVRQLVDNVDVQY